MYKNSFTFGMETSLQEADTPYYFKNHIIKNIIKKTKNKKIKIKIKKIITYLAWRLACRAGPSSHRNVHNLTLAHSHAIVGGVERHLRSNQSLTHRLMYSD